MAPRQPLEGKNVANPMSMILAAAGLLIHIEEKAANRVSRANQVSRAIYEATLEAVMMGCARPIWVVQPRPMSLPTR